MKRAAPIWCLLSSLSVAALGHSLYVPLAWVIGPMLVTAAFSLSGYKVFAPVAGRRMGQIIIGSSVGLTMTAQVLAALIGWLPWMIMTALSSILIASMLSVAYAHFSGVNRTTAYFAMMPGGLSEMANLGHAQGAQSEPIALTQALRVAIVVFLLPPFVLAFGKDGGFTYATAVPLPLGQALGVLVVSMAGTVLAQLLRLNNPWMIGAVFIAGAISAGGLVNGIIPRPLFWLGQFCIGVTIGARFRREIVMQMVRITFVSGAFVVIATILMFAYATVMAITSGIDIPSATLASSIGGFAEMTITSQTLHLNTALVTAFHITRSVLVNAFALHYLHLLRRTGYFDFFERLLKRFV